MRFVQESSTFTRTLSERDVRTMAYVHGCIGQLGRAAIRNVETQLLALDTGAYVFPVSVNSQADVNNSYVVSPHTTYVRYAQFELEQLHRPWLTAPLTVLVKGLSQYLRYARADDIVQVNNSLVSTNLYPADWHAQDIVQIRDFMLAHFPKQTLAFRSLNDYQHSEWLASFLAHGFIAIPSRQVYILDLRHAQHAQKTLKKRNVQADARLLQQHGYRFKSAADLLGSDFEHLEHLYNQLYLGKYSVLNPQYTAEFLRRGQRDGWLDLRALCDQSDAILGVVGIFGDLDTMTVPIFGYDLQRPVEQGLYRTLFHQTLEHVVASQCIFNCSSGAPQFKRHRGAVPSIEYTMVYVAHLPKRQQYAWSVLSKVLHQIAVPLIKKYQL